jgi:hypothetical protein
MGSGTCAARSGPVREVRLLPRSGADFKHEKALKEVMRGPPPHGRLGGRVESSSHGPRGEG